MDRMISTQQFTFHFEGTRAHEISALTLAAGLSALNEIVVNTQNICYPDSEMNLKVTANKEGSFVVVLQMLALTASSMFTPENVNYAADAVTIIGGMLSARKFLKGKNAKSITRTTDNKSLIESSSGEVRAFRSEAAKLLENAKIENSIIQIIYAAESDPSITGLRFNPSDGKMPVDISRGDFEMFSTPIVEPAPKETIAIISTDTLFVKQAEIMGDAQWKFIKEKTISAKILDVEWISDFKLGKYPIVPGLSLRLELRTILEVGEDGLPLENKATFEVLKVLDTIYPPQHKQMSI